MGCFRACSTSYEDTSKYKPVQRAPMSRSMAGSSSASILDKNRINKALESFKSIHANEYDKLQLQAEMKDTRNPDPFNFKIKRSYTQADFVVMEINYPNCTNYEGNKILVYKGYKKKEIEAQTALDPHFFDKGIHPFARFSPTQEGWEAACKFVKNYHKL